MSEQPMYASVHCRQCFEAIFSSGQPGFQPIAVASRAGRIVAWANTMCRWCPCVLCLAVHQSTPKLMQVHLHPDMPI